MKWTIERDAGSAQRQFLCHEGHPVAEIRLDARPGDVSALVQLIAEKPEPFVLGQGKRANFTLTTDDEVEA